jgi:hypothetical protein
VNTDSSYVRRSVCAVTASMSRDTRSVSRSGVGKPTGLVASEKNENSLAASWTSAARNVRQWRSSHSGAVRERTGVSGGKTTLQAAGSRSPRIASLAIAPV